MLLLVAVTMRGPAVGADKKSIKYVEEWGKASPSEAQIPNLTKAQLLVELEKAAAASRKLASWEARYQVFSRVGAGSRESRAVRLVWSGKKWLYERRRGDFAEGDVEYRMVSDGDMVRTLSPKRKSGMIQRADQLANHSPGTSNAPQLPLGFVPFLDDSSESYLPASQTLPEVRKILSDPETKLVPWRTRVNGNACYVVERTTVLESPIFKSREELEAWRKRNPNRDIFGVIHPGAKPGDVRIDKTRTLLALDPKSGFMPVRWADGTEMIIPGFEARAGLPAMPGFELAQFPVDEITCSEFRTFGNKGYVPGQLKYAHVVKGESVRDIAKQSQVVLEDFQVNREYTSDFFDCPFPESCHVMDRVRGIQYSVEDSDELIAALVAAAKAKKEFYEDLKRRPAPPLEGTAWINSKPIRLENAKGKQVVLLFWGIGCKGAEKEVPLLQWEYDFLRRQPSSDRLLISVHQYVDGGDLEELKEFLRKNGITTLPVMIDSRAPDGLSWGKTFAHYRVFGMPRKVNIDEKGHFAGFETEECVGVGDWWTKNFKRKPTGGKEAQRKSPSLPNSGN
jgi:hypothetical protein